MKDPLTRAVKPIRHRRTKTPLSVEIKSAYRTLVITLTILGVGATGVYLSTNSQRLAKGYELKELQANYEALQSEQRKLNQKVIEAQSFLQIEENDRIESMQNIEDQPTSYVDDSNLAQAEADSRTDSATQ